MSSFLKERSKPEAGNCWGYHYIIWYENPILYMGKLRFCSHYFGSCNHNRLIERLDEQAHPEILEENCAYTIRNGTKCFQSNWIFQAFKRYGVARLELAEVKELPTSDLEEAGKIWDEARSKAYELMGELAYGK